MAIAEGLSATKAGFDLLKSALEMLKRDHVDRQEVAAQLLELQGLILDTRRALADAEEENRKLQTQLSKQRRHDAIEQDLLMEDDGQFLVRQSEKEKGKNIPYCPVCWGQNFKLIPLTPGMTKGIFHCGIHNANYMTTQYHDALKTHADAARNTNWRGSPWS